MQLLHCNPISNPQFASLSLLLKDDKQASALTVASPYATLPLSTVCSCVNELQDHVYSIQQGTTVETKTVDDQFCADDASRILSSNNNDSSVNVFHPGNGMALHYSVIREKGLVQKCASILVQGASSQLSVESVSGILLTVGISGVAHAHSSSTLVSNLSTRIHDFQSILRDLIPYADTAECIKSVMATTLLQEVEERKTNAMIDLQAVTLSSEIDITPIEKLKSPIGAVRKSAKKGRRSSSLLKDDAIVASSDLPKTLIDTLSSAHEARITAEKVAILSVSEHESQLRKYEATGLQRRSSMAMSLGKTKSLRRKKSGKADLEGFDCPSMPLKTQQPLEKLPALRPPGLDTASQIPHRSFSKTPRLSPKKPAALPTLLAPRNDVVVNHRRTGQQTYSSRKWSMTNGTHRGASDISTPRQQAAFNAFAVGESAVNESFANGSFPNQAQFAGVMNGSTTTTGGGDPWGMTIPASATTEFNNNTSATVPSSFGGGTSPEQRRRFDLASPSDERELTSPPSAAAAAPSRTRDDAVESLQRMLLAAERSEMNGLKDDDDISRGSRSSFQNGEWLEGMMDQELLSAHSELDQLVAKVTPAENGGELRLMINVALNEDLTCSYRQSKMSSCSIEGVVQVQVSCDTRDGVPFYLLVRDPSRHIRIVQENKRFADSMSEELKLSDNPDDADVDQKYAVSVPSADDYFPVLRYKCSSELRPVPIRVQTRVRVNEGASCRVALQISSNPANEDDLTDLTIVMGVPLEVKGETLVTTPAGGVWNAAKRSVIWCVKELGSGEKFQLQAEFEMHPDSRVVSKPKFPVLVRCQCMYAQLSDVELEVSDIANVFPADVTMKMARRFRLSHRERS